MIRKVLLSVLFLFLVVMVSGCTSTKSNLLNVSDTFSEAIIRYWDNYAENTIEMGNPIFPDRTNFSLFSQVCPIHEEIFENIGSISIYRLSECGFAKINILKNDNDYGVKASYVQLSSRMAHSIMIEKINSSFYDLYAWEQVTEADPTNTVIESITKKITDMGVMTFVTESEGSASAYLMSKIECNESSLCVDSFFERMETATSKIIEEIEFDNDSVSSCEIYLQTTDKNQIINQLKYALEDIFEKTGHQGNADDYISYTRVCRRIRTLYFWIYNEILDDVSEPAQRFYIATAFYILSNLGETPESFTDSLNQLIG